MDSIDEKILTILKLNARTKITHIAKEIHLSETSVIERIRKLENSPRSILRTAKTTVR